GKFVLHPFRSPTITHICRKVGGAHFSVLALRCSNGIILAQSQMFRKGLGQFFTAGAGLDFFFKWRNDSVIFQYRRKQEKRCGFMRF
ncbi:MAG: hypothetical protein KA928_09665, partial [Longilinea sp.]|nr:hypothetical protein [Longilinea sp.]